MVSFPSVNSRTACDLDTRLSETCWWKISRYKKHKVIEKIPTVYTKQMYENWFNIYPKERSPSDCSFTRGNRNVPSSLLRSQCKGSHFDCNFIVVVLLKIEGPLLVWDAVCSLFCRDRTFCSKFCAGGQRAVRLSYALRHVWCIVCLVATCDHTLFPCIRRLVL